MTAKTTSERQESLRMRRALLGLAEVRGIYLPPDMHAAIKAQAAKMLSKWQKHPQGAPMPEREMLEMAARAAGKWLPIESAPRSKLAGQILTFRQGTSALHGRRNTTPAQKWQSSGQWYQTSFWSEQHGLWVGWPLNTQPTHWMPLPPPPTGD